MASETKICGPWMDCVAVFTLNGKPFDGEHPVRIRATDKGYELDRQIETKAAPHGGVIHVEFFRGEDRSVPLATTNHGRIEGSHSLALTPSIIAL